ncbi:MAG: helix-turn-helix domain-containing protein, partial [Stackebrandtia sp.]
MSVEAITWALRDAPDVPPHLVSTLFGLANHADPNGKGAFPGLARLASYTRKEQRVVRKDLTALLKLGLIRKGDQRLISHIRPDKRPVVYDLAIE